MEKWHCREWSVASPSIDTGGTTQLMKGQLPWRLVLTAPPPPAMGQGSSDLGR
jgi:hypothetical protein